MEILLRSPSGLYPTLLGGAWHRLHPVVRRLHGSATNVRAAGRFQVRHGSSRWARLLARLARLPAASHGVDVQLLVSVRDGGEEWRRTFARRPLVSVQFALCDGILVERMGIMEMRFRLAVVGGSLSYQTLSAALRLGFLCAPLPYWLSPHVTAWESAVGDEDRLCVSVEVNSPWFGPLIAYDGSLTQIEVTV